MNWGLLASFTTEEVEIALKNMQLLKSPGPDGFATGFYQNSWHLMGREVCANVLDFLNAGNFDPDANKTYIALIPKKKNPNLCI